MKPLETSEGLAIDMFKSLDVKEQLILGLASKSATSCKPSEPVIESVETSAGVSADEDDAMDYFKKLAQD